MSGEIARVIKDGWFQSSQSDHRRRGTRHLYNSLYALGHDIEATHSGVIQFL